MPSTLNPYLFVYGSLRQGFNAEAYRYIAQYFQLVGSGSVAATMYDKGNYPVVVPQQNTPYKVYGELYLIRNPNELAWAIAQLDDYEGVVVEHNEAASYTRAITPVHMNNNIINANVYWYCGTINNLPIVAHGDVFEYLKSKL